MFSNPGVVTRDSLYFAYTNLIRSVKDDRYKLIEYRNHAAQTQLFDLAEDPHEINDLADCPDRADVLARLRKLMDDKRLEWNDFEHPLSLGFWGENVHQGN